MTLELSAVQWPPYVETRVLRHQSLVPILLALTRNTWF